MRYLNAYFSLILLFIGTNFSSFSQTVSFTLFDTLNARHYADISSGDINNDSVPDFLFIGTTNGPNNHPVILKYSDTGFVVQTHFGSSHVENGDAHIRDMNQDNLLDAIYQGSGRKLQIQGQNSNQTFSTLFSDYGSGNPRGMDIGDYDNDGDMDVIVVGPHVSFQPLLHLYTNNGGTFTQSSPISLAPRKEGDAAFGDFDGDLDLDLIVSGTDSNNIDHTYLYENNNGVFSFRDSLDGTHYSNIIIQDVNADGMEDIVLAGRYMGNFGRTRPYINQGNFNFSPTNYPSFQIVSDQGLSFGDIDADGDLDLFTQGQSGNFFYTNDGTGTYTQINTPFDSLSVGASTLLDFEHDGDLDLITSGYSHTSTSKEGYTYKNTGTNFNTLPSPPTTGNYFWSGNDLTLSWNRGSDAETDSLGLTYNVFLLNVATGQYIVSPEADTSTGYKFRNARGNTGTITGRLIKNLPSGAYIWGVQSVDNHFSGSTFYTQNIMVCQNPASPAITIVDNDSVCDSDSILLNIVSLAGFTNKWYDNSGTIANSNNALSIYAQPHNQVFVEFIDQHGCVLNSDTVQLTGIPKPTPSITNNGINNGFCPSDSIRLNIAGNFSSIQWMQNSSVLGMADSLWTSQTGTFQALVTDSTGICTSDTIITQILDHQPTAIQFSSLAPICISNNPFLLNTATPTGGSYSGIGINSNIYTPSAVGSGIHEYYYSYTNTNGCTSKDTTFMTINALSNAGTITGDSVICFGDSSTFSTTNIIGNDFQWQSSNTFNMWNTFSVADTFQSQSPSQSTLYRLIVKNGSCPADTTPSFNVQVNSLPIVTTAPQPNICISSNAISLSSTPSGGSYLGIGTSGNQFTPSQAGAGTHLIIYNYTDSLQCSASDSISIQVDATSIAGNIAGVDSICAGLSTTLTLSGHTGSDIIWTETIQNTTTTISSNTTFINVSASSSAIYKAMVSNGVCDADTAVHALRIDTIPVVQISALNTLCQSGSSIYLGATPLGGNYFINNTPTSSTLYPNTLNVGTHWLKYNFSNIYGCNAQDSISFSIDSSSISGQFAHDSSNICDGNSIALNLSNHYGNILNWQISTDSGASWSSIANSSSSFVHQTNLVTNYRSIVQNGVCSPDTSNITTVIVHSNPQVSLANDTICANETISDLSYLANLTGGTFQGTDVTGSSFSSSVAGLHTYSYTFTNAFGCIGSDTAEILVNSIPQVIYDSSFVICNQSTLIDLGVGTPASGSFTGTGVSGNQWDCSLSGTGQFDIFYTVNNVNGCMNSDTGSITINPNPVVTLANDTICINETINDLNPLVNISGGTFYGTNVTGSSFTSAVAGTHIFSYSYTNLHGCIDSDTAEILVNPLPQVIYDSNFVTCNQDSLIDLGTGTPALGFFTGTGVNGNQWDGTLSGSGQFEIYYTVNDTNGCVNMDTGNIVIHPPVIVNIGDTFAIVDSITLNAGSFNNYLWNTGANTSSINVYQPGTYSVIVWDSNNCSGFDSVQIVISGIGSLAQNLDINMYPNPATDHIEINGSYLQEIDRVTIYNMQGQALLSKSIHLSKRVVLDLSSIPVGTYILDLLQENQSVFQKIIVVAQ